VASSVQSRIFINHIPLQREESIRNTIRSANSPIRFADELYSDNVKKIVINAKNSAGLKEVVFPGSFDPFTSGHLSHIKKHLKANKTDTVTVMLAVNP
jgi:hypothetical protein